MAQGVQIGRAMSGGGRHVTHERYRGRHRKPRPQRRPRTGIRLAITAACAALLVCLPQPSWADRSGAVPVPVPAHPAAANQATVNSLPNPFWQQPHH